jgi:hypothetical protein
MGLEVLLGADNRVPLFLPMPTSLAASSVAFPWVAPPGASLISLDLAPNWVAASRFRASSSSMGCVFSRLRMRHRIPILLILIG